MKAQRPVRRSALLLVAFLAAACGNKITAPTQETPVVDNPEPPTIGEIKGYPIFAVDDNNDMFLFGSESPGTIALQLKITGLPFLNYIVGIDFRPSDGKLYGIGDDARVYVINTATGAATAVSSEPFTSELKALDHYGMGIDPETEKIRLMSIGGRNWSIDPDDGTAVREADAHYAPGDPNEGKTLHVAALDYISPETAGAAWLPASVASVAAAASSPIATLVYDGFSGELAESIDPSSGEFTSLGPVDGVAASYCFTVAFDPTGSLLAFGAVAGLVAGPELAGAYALVELSPSGVVDFIAGEFGASQLTTSIQSMAIAENLGGLGS